MELSVIIVNHNSAGFLAACLASLDQHIREVHHEIVVVDNASHERALAIVRDRFPRTRFILNGRNLGFSAAINVGLMRTTGKYVLWLNPDTEFKNNGVTQLLRYLDDHPSVGIVGPQIVNADGSLQFSCRSFPTPANGFFNRQSMMTRLFPRNRFSRRYLLSDWDHSTVRPVDWVSGACLLHRRQLSNEMCGLDERYFIYIEDVDFCRCARKAGWDIHYHPELRVLHHIGGSTSRVPFPMIFAQHRSIWHYYAKHSARNPLKDFVTASAIWSRCAGMAVHALATGRARPADVQPPAGTNHGRNGLSPASLRK